MRAAESCYFGGVSPKSSIFYGRRDARFATRIFPNDDARAGWDIRMRTCWPLSRVDRWVCPTRRGRTLHVQKRTRGACLGANGGRCLRPPEMSAGPRRESRLAGKPCRRETADGTQVPTKGLFPLKSHRPDGRDGDGGGTAGVVGMRLCGGWKEKEKVCPYLINI